MRPIWAAYSASASEPRISTSLSYTPAAPSTPRSSRSGGLPGGCDVVLLGAVRRRKTGSGSGTSSSSSGSG